MGIKRNAFLHLPRSVCVRQTQKAEVVGPFLDLRAELRKNGHVIWHKHVKLVGVEQGGVSVIENSEVVRV